jgi:transcriptional antiterminator RfaH
LFLHTDIEQVGLSTFQWLPFSLGLVSFGDEPAAVPDNLVHEIRRRVDALNAVSREHFPNMKQGDAIVIRGGPFEGYDAIFDTRLSDGERVRVLLKLLEVRQMKLELSAQQVQRKN